MTVRSVDAEDQQQNRAPLMVLHFDQTNKEFVVGKERVREGERG